MIRFSANLGFLWTDRPLPDAIRAARAAGFDAVECHWPYGVLASDVSSALQATGLRMLGINVRRGMVEAGDNGLAALPDRRREARAAIMEAIAYAEAIDASAIHVMAGRARGGEANDCFLENLAFAASRTDRTILIEPLNRHDAPQYFLETTEQARCIIREVGAPNLKLMFDCYHVGRSEGDLITRLKDLLPIVGHIQFAAVPDRGPPDHGEVDYGFIFSSIRDLGWTNPLGAEYRPRGDTEASLGWMSALTYAL